MTKMIEFSSFKMALAAVDLADKGIVWSGEGNLLLPATLTDEERRKALDVYIEYKYTGPVDRRITPPPYYPSPDPAEDLERIRKDREENEARRQEQIRQKALQDEEMARHPPPPPSPPRGNPPLPASGDGSPPEASS